MRLIDADAYIYSNDLKNEPTIEAEPVRHGEWVMKEILVKSPFAKNAYCSECLEETAYTHNYCPNCGAKMRGTTDE